ncbi:hypothetical protein HELRODRAFT_76841 [Helobdella robusta]|uniref:Ciliary microtubule inner protein 2C n=1 Tax=Helobdella robusta TaxID=6412 RepID=T1G2Q0_HELRO|nr:hypothetical protein HELRODRAFT_76841 [Helobdella robusta]ESO07029.1 hypothetical protein HELRODRAFT_76841 [Helobdella robusta]
MSNASGWLVTTNQAACVHPRFMPGYKGYVPTMKYEHGETYGNQTNKCFQDFRSKTFETSRTLSNRGGYFATRFTSNPDLACEARTRKLDRWLQLPTYKLTNQDYTTLHNRVQFMKLAMCHRAHYNDYTGTIPSVGYFQEPKPFETREMFTTRKNISYCCNHLE